MNSEKQRKRDKWLKDQNNKLDYIEWSIEKEETDPLYDEKINMVLGFFEKNGIGPPVDKKGAYGKIERLYEFISEYKDFKLPNFLNYESRLN
ncbi:MAG: hypothetical protein IIB77_13960 [Proteobacteria bacterium]|nr:hypothetical protein [Pseudomonadota bacterium]